MIYIKLYRYHTYIYICMNKYIYFYMYIPYIYMVFKRRYHDNHENHENNVFSPSVITMDLSQIMHLGA